MVTTMNTDNNDDGFDCHDTDEDDKHNDGDVHFDYYGIHDNDNI